MSDDKKNDVVKGEDYNKVVESHNSLKLENEKMKQELNDLKAKQNEEKARADIEKQKADYEKQIADLKKNAEESKKSVVAKGIVTENSTEMDKIRRIVDANIPNAKVDVKNMPSAYGRLRHFKSGMTKQFTKEQLGKGLALSAAAQAGNPNLLNPLAKDSQTEIVFKRQ